MRKIAIKYGVMMFVGFTLLFLVMHLFGQSQNYNLRIFNGVIHLGFMYLAINEYKAQFPESDDNYLNGLSMGFFSSLVGILPFAIFLMIFLDQTPALMTDLKENTPVGEYLNPVMAAVFVLVEGLAISLIGGYIITRVVLINHHQPEV